MPSRHQTQDEPVTRVFRVHPVFSPEEGSLLEEIEPGIWRQIVHHALPLHPPNTAIRLLVVRGTAERCEAIDALQLETDHFGFLLTWELDPAEALPSLTPAAPAAPRDQINHSVSQHTAPKTDSEPDTTPATGRSSRSTTGSSKASSKGSSKSPSKGTLQKSSVVDSRQRFLHRYLSHRHSWHPSPSVLEQALAKSGYATPE